MNWSILLHESVVFAMLGAFIMQLLGLLELSRVPIPERPDFRDLFYGLPFLIGPIVGGFLALVYIYPAEDPADTLKPLVAINIGVSAPLILRTMARINPFESRGIKTGSDA